MTDRIDDLLAKLDLSAKIRLVSGANFFRFAGDPDIGLAEMPVSDGPSGVRGEQWDERDPSVSLPSGTALAATWDRDLLTEIGALIAAEARRKDVYAVLGPTINLHRSPLGGRHFECFSEDPMLTAEMADAYVRAVQAHGVSACPKHYVANDSETQRFTADVIADDRTLRELYLYPFERSVEAGAWMVMAAYNSVNGVTMTENDLLDEPLKGEWGFDGVVVSDWTAVRSTMRRGQGQRPGHARAVGAVGCGARGSRRQGRSARGGDRRKGAAHTAIRRPGRRAGRLPAAGPGLPRRGRPAPGARGRRQGHGAREQ